jgi:hypothetical protein
MAAPAGWSGRFWARTGCAFDGASGKCATGDCGSGELECHGSGAEPPATLVEFTLAGGASKEDYYDVSLVDGYNVPVVVEAAGCPATGCLVDLNERCPQELTASAGQGCRSACEAFGRPEFCCSGDFGNPDTCHPSTYSQAFKAACPRAYSYAYDDATSTFTCSGSDAYSVTFCPRAGAIPSRYVAWPAGECDHLENAFPFGGEKEGTSIDQTKLCLCSFPTTRGHQPRSWVVLAALKAANA